MNVISLGWPAILRESAVDERFNRRNSIITMVTQNALRQSLRAFWVSDSFVDKLAPVSLILAMLRFAESFLGFRAQTTGILFVFQRAMRSLPHKTQECFPYFIHSP